MGIQWNTSLIVIYAPYFRNNHKYGFPLKCWGTKTWEWLRLVATCSSNISYKDCSLRYMHSSSISTRPTAPKICCSFRCSINPYHTDNPPPVLFKCNITTFRNTLFEMLFKSHSTRWNMPFIKVIQQNYETTSIISALCHTCHMFY